MPANTAGTDPSPETAASAHVPARRGLRLLAYIADWLVAVILASIFVSAGGLQLYLATDGGSADPPDLSIYLFLGISALALPAWFLITLVGWSRAGLSVGKLAMGLRIVDRQRRPPGLLRGGLRLIFYSLESLFLFAAPVIAVAGTAAGGLLPRWSVPLSAALAVGALLALMPALVGRAGRALHDLVAGTVVVEE